MITAKQAKEKAEDVSYQIDMMRKSIEQLIIESAEKGLYQCEFQLRKAPNHTKDRETAAVLEKELIEQGFKTELFIDLKIFW